MTSLISDYYIDQIRQTRESRPQWGSGGGHTFGIEVNRFLERNWRIKTVLDYGCGNGTLGQYIREHGRADIEWTDYDPSVQGLDKLPDRSFDCILSSDVMEHVEPEYLDVTLEWIAARCTTQFHRIDCNANAHRLPDGRDVHLIVQQPEWWEERLLSQRGAWVTQEMVVQDVRKRGVMRRACLIRLEKMQ